jgi:hypothetical protein
MAAECEFVLEAGVATSIEQVTIGSDAFVTAAAGVVLALTLGFSVTEQATAQSFDSGYSLPVLTSSAVASSYMQTGGVRAVEIDSSAVATESLAISIGSDLASTGTAASYVVSGSQVAVSTALASSFPVTAVIAREVLASSAIADSAFSGTQSLVEQSSAVAGSLAYPSAQVRLTAESSASSLSYLVAGASYSYIIDEQAVAISSAQAATTNAAVIEEQAIAAGSASIGSSGVIWTCPTVGFAMSQLLADKTDSAAMLGGVLYCAGEAGIYAFDAAQEQDCGVTTGLIDMGNSRATYCYVGYSGEEMTLRVGNTGAGTETEYEYALTDRSAESAVPNRAKFGKGIRSRYWRFSVSGTQFSLHDLVIVSDTVSRRV